MQIVCGSEAQNTRAETLLTQWGSTDVSESMFIFDQVCSLRRVFLNIDKL